MRRKKHIAADLNVMHGRYQDLLSAYNASETKLRRLEERVSLEWESSRRCARQLVFAENQVKDFEKYLQGQGVKLDRVGDQRWGIVYQSTPESLDMHSNDVLRVTWDHISHAFEFYFSTHGTQADLVRTIDRTIWTMKNIRAKAIQEPDENGHF